MPAPARGAGALGGRVAIVTGGGRGLGRQHALLLAREGAAVVVNDTGAGPDGSGRDPAPAAAVAAEIEAAGGRAVANTDDVADWEGGRRLVDAAVAAFGDLHVLVNNAGILCDRFLVTMTEEEWDDVVRVHLKGHFVPTRWAAAHWRAQARAGRDVRAAVVNTSSTSGLFGNPGQANYGAAKAGIAAFTLIAAEELARYGVRCNAVVPLARTRLTESVPAVAAVVRAPDDPSSFDAWDPANVSPVVAYLATEACPLTGQVLFVHGTTVQLLEGWRRGPSVTSATRWTLPRLQAEMPQLVARFKGAERSEASP